MAKCPWCGKPTWVAKNMVTKKFTHACMAGCYESREYDNASEALAAASKRFMPKRTVEDICAGVSEFVETNRSAVALMKKDGVLKGNNDAYLLAIMCHRIADFIYGAE